MAFSEEDQNSITVSRQTKRRKHYEISKRVPSKGMVLRWIKKTYKKN